MFTNKTITANLDSSKEHTVFLSALKKSGVAEQLNLKGKIKYTVFAPVDVAFSSLPAGFMDNLMKPENLEDLVKFVSYFIVDEKMDLVMLTEYMKKNKGKPNLQTLNGETLSVVANGDRNIYLRDVKGNTANISTYNVTMANGVLYVIDNLLFAK
jgi:uncharacterized surface protein with fasciclin (FAS1) repeats